MNRETVDRIVSATLYEGYILYPYRADAVKNRVRWTFGGVHPRTYSEATGGSDPWEVETECLVRGGPDARITAEVRFLHPVRRRIGKRHLGSAGPEAAPGGASPVDTTPLEELAPGFLAVDYLDVAGVPYRAWEEAVERRLDLGTHRLGDLVGGPRSLSIEIPAGSDREELVDSDGSVAGIVLRVREELQGSVEVTAAWVCEDVARVRLVVRNTTPFEMTGERDRDRAMLRALVSTHAILGVDGGRWISLADPPEDLVEAASACRNRGLWPVLVGDPDVDDTVLASPIILQDHPEVAPESPQDLFDGTEIDELLSLRILTLTDEEKQEMRAADARSRAILERTEKLGEEEMLRLHGTIRQRTVRGQEEVQP